MNKSQRIYFNTGTTINDNYLIVQLEEQIDTIEFMSMDISTKDAYQNFNSDYGVLVGRVLANGGIGVPNAKISIFIPLTDTDANNGEIFSIYPYKTPRDKNSNGKRYNLLPRVSQINPVDETISPKQPFGSFPIIEEVVTNAEFLNVYQKYYKYTALTNAVGDYMIFGVPVGLQTVHMSIDITDIGKYSMTPAAMVTNLGYSPNFFMDNNTKIKPSNDLNDLPNIETQEISVNVIPFWGDSTNFIIGITRQDFRIRSVLNNTFVIFGSAFTDGDNSMWGDNFYTTGGEYEINELYRMRDDANLNVSIKSKRIGIISEKIYYYPANISDADIDSGNVDPTTQMVLLGDTQYSAYKRNGDFAFIINCNRNKIITDELGNNVSVPDNSINGIYSKFRGFITLELTIDSVPMNFIGDIGGGTRLLPLRYALKFPQYASNLGNGFSMNENQYTDAWRKQIYTFSGGNFYSLSKFHGVVFNDTKVNHSALNYNGTFSVNDYINYPYGRDPFWNTTLIQVGDNNSVSGNTQYQMIGNTTVNDGTSAFAANWLNLTVYLPQVGYLTDGSWRVDYWNSTSNFTQDFRQHFFYENNVQPIAGGQVNTKWFARSDLHWTDIINVPKGDIIKMNSPNISKGFINTIIPLTGEYRNGVYTPPLWSAPCPFQGGMLYGNPLLTPDPITYFYKGFDSANCIEFIMSLGLV